MVASSNVRNLQMRKHRFDSVLRPLGRFVLHFDAVLQTAVWIAVQRRGEPQGKEAEECLAGISEAHVILAGMCADAAHESILLVRFLDTEKHDVAEVPMECDAYLSKLHYLFNEALLQLNRHFIEGLIVCACAVQRQQPLCFSCACRQGNVTKHGFTKVALDKLRVPRGFLVRGEPRTLGGGSRVTEARLRKSGCA